MFNLDLRKVFRILFLWLICQLFISSQSRLYSQSAHSMKSRFVAFFKRIGQRIGRVKKTNSVFAAPQPALTAAPQPLLLEAAKVFYDETEVLSGNIRIHVGRWYIIEWSDIFIEFLYPSTRKLFELCF